MAGRPGVAAAALGVTGFASLTLQVVWTRLLASMLGPTTYAFSAVVAVFILGIAGGSAIGAWLSRRLRQPSLALAVCVIVAGGLALAAATMVDATVLSVAHLVANPQVTFQQVVIQEWMLTAAILLPMALAFGAAFPLALAVAARTDDTMVADLGLVYAVNTLGAILGALLAGFVLIPWLGLHDTIRVVAVLTAVAGAAIAVVARPSSSWLALGLAVVVCAGAWVVPSWNPLLLSSGAYKYAPSLRGPDLADGAHRRRAALLPRGLDRHRGGAAAGRHHVAGDRRQGGRLERRRHAHAATAGARAVAAASRRRSGWRSSASAAASRSAPRSRIRSSAPTCSRFRPRSSRPHGSSKPRTTAPCQTRARGSSSVTAARTCCSATSSTT